MKSYTSHYINGGWHLPSSNQSTPVINPANGTTIATVPAGNAQDVNSAVAAARQAFSTWSTTSAAERSRYMEAIANALNKHADAMAQVISAELGCPIGLAQKVHVGLPIAVLRSFIPLTQEMEKQERIGHSVVIKEPVGVCGFITPWNYPLHQIVAKVAPALAAGCTMVLKPSQETPLTAFLFAEIVHEAGLPAGVFNVVGGSGSVVGEAIARHPEIDMVSITGSTGAGIRVAELAAHTVKRVCQELGGKSANIVLEDADLKGAVTRSINDITFNSGQTCSALTRLLVPRALHDEAVQIARTLADNVQPGDPASPTTFMGPMVSEQQRNSVVKYIQKGIDEGATLIIGGTEKPAGLENGAYVRPTVFANVHNNMTIAQEEIFGPVLCIIPYDNEADAVAIANDTPYGLSGAVWAKDTDKAVQIARKIRTGQLLINGGAFNPLAPFGGYKQSGNGRELGPLGLHEFTELKSLQLPS